MTIGEWKTIGRPGWFGESKDRILSEYDQKYGNGNWRIRHKLGPRTLDFTQAISLYELSYELDFNHPDRRYIWTNLINEASEVWTEELLDVESGQDYSIQRKIAHYEDIAIRRIFQKYGVTFKGNRMLRVRGDSEDLVGKALSSIHVPFAYPQHIESSFEKTLPWWDRFKGSVESFWQLNKILQIKDNE